MPRSCTVCAHDAREAIDRALAGGESVSGVAIRYGLSWDAVKRHGAAHLPKAVVVAQAGVEEAHALDVMEELTRCFQRVNLLFDACDRWLRDADDPTRYDIGPRTGDILVTYEEPGADGKPIRRKEALDRLLARVESSGMALERWDTKYADPRELVLKTAQQLTGQTQLLAKLMGQLDERPQINVLMAPEWLQVRAALLTALAPYAEARQAVAAALVSIEAGPVTGAA
jgi:hypothetical protein